MFVNQVYKAIKYHRKQVEQLVGKKNARLLFGAIRRGENIIVYEKNVENSLDGRLYRSLKALGAENVYNYSFVMERDKKIKGVFCAFFHEG